MSKWDAADESPVPGCMPGRECNVNKHVCLCNANTASAMRINVAWWYKHTDKKQCVKGLIPAKVRGSTMQINVA
jgi:hypothetical protein